MREMPPPTPAPSESLWAQMLLLLGGTALLLGWLVLRRSTRSAAPVVVAGCAILFTRDTAMAFTGALGRLRPPPGLLLLMELATSGTGVAAGCLARASRRCNGSARVHTAVGRAAVHGEQIADNARLARLSTFAATATAPCTPCRRRSTSAQGADGARCVERERVHRSRRDEGLFRYARTPRCPTASCCGRMCTDPTPMRGCRSS